MDNAPRRPWTWLVAGAVLAALAMTTLLPALADSRSPQPLPRVAFVARNDVPFDALSVGPVAGALGGVTVITSGSTLSQEAEDALTSFAPDRVYIVGGTVAISAATEQEIDDAGPWTVERLAGVNRDETAERISGLPATLGYERPVLTENGIVFGAWADDYASHGHDHGIQPGAGGEATRRGGVVHDSATAVDGSGWDVVAALTVPNDQLHNSCPVGTPIHNFLVEASGTVTNASGGLSARLATTLNSTSWPSSADDGDEDAGRLVRLGGTDDAGSFATHHLFTALEDAELTFRLLAQSESGGGTFDVTPGTLVVQHLGYECSP